jgi:hypothetical protein
MKKLFALAALTLASLSTQANAKRFVPAPPQPNDFFHFGPPTAVTPVKAIRGRPRQIEQPAFSPFAGFFSFQDPFLSFQHGSTNLLSVASRYVDRGNVTGFNGKWCAAFANKVMTEGGYRHNNSLAAIDKIHDGKVVMVPLPGDLVVMRHHVTIFAGYTGKGQIIGLGGNQNHNVNKRAYSPHRVVAFVRPVRA